MCLLIILLVLLFLYSPLLGGIIVAIGVIYLIIDSISTSNELEEIKIKKKERWQAQQMEKARAEQEVQRAITDMTSEYGKVKKIVRLENHDENANINKCFIVFSESSLLYVDGKTVLFSDIISYNITDDYKIKHGNAEYSSETTTSTGSLLGRSAVGAVIGGGVGAVIGASSASKNTTTIKTQKDDTIIHQYTLSLNIRSLESPLIRMDLGHSTRKAEEVNAILAYIIDLNKEEK